MSVKMDLTGHRYGRLTVIRESPNRGTPKRVRWVCRCDCGNETTVSGNAMRRGNTRSCGCLISEGVRRRSTTHGMSRAPEFWVWSAMRNRTTNPNDRNWKHYGGRGIGICERWLTFENFYADMGLRPSAKHTIERKDNDGPYSPENCCWILMSAQALNKRNARLLEYDGRIQHLIEWARETGLNSSDILYRLKAGWSVEKALTTPTPSSGSRRENSGSL